MRNPSLVCALTMTCFAFTNPAWASDITDSRDGTYTLSADISKPVDELRQQASEKCSSLSKQVDIESISTTGTMVPSPTSNRLADASYKVTTTILKFTCK
jgi:hypothetical protein